MEHKKSKKLYALKYIDKAKCIKQKAVANIIQARRLLEEVSIPCLLASSSRAVSCWPTRPLLVPPQKIFANPPSMSVCIQALRRM